LPVRVTPTRLLLDANFNGQPAEVIVDTGAATSLVFTDAARRLGLSASDAYGSGTAYGAGGGFAVKKVHVQDFQLGGAHVKDVSFWTGGRTIGGAAMLLGQDVLRNWDVEYDLQHGAMRLFHPMDCHGDDVAYWAKAYAKADMHHGGTSVDMINLDILLNGAKIAAMLDTGAPFTVITPSAAQRAGVTAQFSALAKDRVGGLGQHFAAGGLATVDSFGLGAETVKNVTVRVADMFAENTAETTGHFTGERVDMPDMLIGLDFVRAHRIMIAPDQKAVYFTYAGGPIFDAVSGVDK
jgi:predicted aspartyl protease